MTLYNPYYETWEQNKAGQRERESQIRCAHRDYQSAVLDFLEAEVGTQTIYPDPDMFAAYADADLLEENDLQPIVITTTQEDKNLLKTYIKEAEERLQDKFSFRNKYAHIYAWAIPNEEALFEIKQYAPLIELGAGSGYWAWLLREQLATNILCYDIAPPSSSSEENTFHPKAQTWTEVLKGDESILDSHGERNLFLCWPPAEGHSQEEFALRVLSRFAGEYFLFVGEESCATGNEKFHELLQSEWTQIKCAELPRWEACDDSLFVFRRK